ncbi:unnamed protein product [Lactuca virosa]|uniref:Uncharacterized protein n=1 Tax=Lactuca virosa TaxID=75947 RepID=A0AAU9LT07_9ASTR|nr:unnamed protein product [Lactuca virosa]
MTHNSNAHQTGTTHPFWDAVFSNRMVAQSVSLLKTRVPRRYILLMSNGFHRWTVALTNHTMTVEAPTARHLQRYRQCIMNSRNKGVAMIQL